MSRLNTYRMGRLLRGRLFGFRNRGVSAAFSVSLTGLTGGEAREGGSIGLTITPALSGETVSYDWQANTVSTGETTSAETVNIGGVHTDGQTLRCVVTIDGVEYTSNTAPMRYAPGSVTESLLADWTIDDDALNVNLASDFTTTNLTGTYVIAGLPTGAVDDGDGTISGEVDGTAEVPATESLTATFTDQYGRTIVGNYTVDTVYRAQATGGADLDLSFAEGTPTVNEDLTANWTTNGNTLTYAIVTPPSLPTNLSVSSAGLLTRSGSVSVTADDTYTLRGTDEYGRTTDDTLTLEITEVDATAPTASSISAGTQQADGDVPITVTSLDENSTAKWVLTSSDQSGAANTAVETAADGGTALTDQSDFGTFSATIGGGPYEEAITSGLDGTYYIQTVFVDAAGNVSVVYADGPITIDTTAPTISSATGTQTGQTTATWGVTSNEADGTIYAGVRPTASAAITAAQLIAGTGGTGVAWDNDATPTADAANGGSFTGLTAATAYKVDVVQVDSTGNESSVVSSAEFTTASASSFPVIEGVAESREDGTSSTFTMSLPAGIVSGELLVAEVCSAPDETVTATGWTVERTGVIHHLLTRTADGTEGATVNVVGGTAGRWNGIVRRISGAASLEHAYDAAVTALDGPSLTPTWGTKKALWFASGAAQQSAWSATATPTGFSNLLSQGSSSSTADSRCKIVSAELESETATVNPDAFTISGTLGAKKSAITYAIEPV